MVEEDKTYENEVSKPEKDTKCCGEHGGKDLELVDLLVLRLRSCGNLWKKWQLNTNILL